MTKNKIIAINNKTNKPVRGRPFPKGVSGNPNGKRVGTQSFSTKWKKFIEKVAERNKLTVDEIEEQLLAEGFRRAKSGEFNFWSNILDRLYGKPLQSTELIGNLDLKIKISEEKKEAIKKALDSM